MKELGHVAAGKREVCRLRYQSGGEEREMTVGEEPLLIGRADSCNLTLSHESVSRHHARVSRFRKGWTITDLDSKNGVKINTFRTARQQLYDGDRIDLGAVRLYVSIAPVAPHSPAQVVFENSHDPRMQTEFIDMDQLDSLLSKPSLFRRLVPLIIKSRSSISTSPRLSRRSSKTLT